MLARLTDGCERVLPIATVIVAATLALRRVDDFDSWWHLAAGRWIITHRSIPSTDTLSFTVPDHAWINVQWLFDCALYLLYRLGGADALVLASAAACTAAIWLLTKNLRLFVGGVPTALLTLWILAVAEERFLVRPEIVSFVLFEALLWLLLTVREDDGRRVWWVVPLMFVWANCHSLFIIGLFCIACAAMAPLAARLPFLPAGLRLGSQLTHTATRRLWIAAAGAMAVTVLNPYGISGVLFPFKLMSRINGSNPAFQNIGEFSRPFATEFPTFSLTAYKWFFVCSTIVVGLATLVSLGRPRGQAARSGRADGIDVARLAIFIGLAYLSVLARRNMALFALGGAPITASALAALDAKLGATIARRLKVTTRVVAPLLVVGCAALVLAIAGNRYYRWDGTTREFGLGVFDVNFPIRAVAFAKEVRVPGKVYNDMTAGGYLTWDAPVEGGVFIDGRLEVYDAPFFARYSTAINNPRAWEQDADRLGVNTVILFHRWPNRHGLLQGLIASRRWALVYYDEVAVVLVRIDPNQRIIAEAQRRFPEWQGRTQAALAAPPASWQWPVARATALESYAALQFTLGYPERGVEFYKQLLDLGVPPTRESAARYQIASYLARIGDARQARAQLAVAAARDPNNVDVRHLLARLGG